MKGVIIAIMVAMCFFYTASCRGKDRNMVIDEKIQKIEENLKAPPGVKKDIYKYYLENFGPEWENFKVNSDMALKQLSEYFGETPYRVIWNWDIDGDGNIEYLAVETFPKIRRSIKRGVIVDEKGAVKLYIDTNIGVYTLEYIVYDLKRAGYKKGVIECFAIGYVPFDLVNGNRKIGSIGNNKTQVESLRNGRYKISSFIGSFELQHISKDLKIIGTPYEDENSSYIGQTGIMISYSPGRNKIFYELFAPPGLDYYADQKETVRKYSRLKKQGKVFSPPASVDPEDVKRMYKILKLQAEIKK